jgi:hypothetical protein
VTTFCERRRAAAKPHRGGAEEKRGENQRKSVPGNTDAVFEHLGIQTKHNGVGPSGERG